MKSVGIRDLKSNLSKYLAEVKDGQPITITDRNRSFAVIMPLKGANEQEELLQLVQKGIAYWSGGRPRGIPCRIPSKGKRISDAVLEGRR